MAAVYIMGSGELDVVDDEFELDETRCEMRLKLGCEWWELAASELVAIGLWPGIPPCVTDVVIETALVAIMRFLQARDD